MVIGQNTMLGTETGVGTGVSRVWRAGRENGEDEFIWEFENWKILTLDPNDRCERVRTEAGLECGGS